MVNRFSKISVILLIVICFTNLSCAGKESIEPDVVIEEVHLKELLRIDVAGDVYFSHLGYSGGVLPDGGIVFPERESASIIKIDENGNLLARTIQGSGPGELLDLSYLTVTKEGRIYTYDQNNKKVVQYDKNLELISEFTPESQGKNFILKGYPVNDESMILQLSSYEYMMDVEAVPHLELVHYVIGTGETVNSVVLKDRSYVRYIIDGALVGGSHVPFSHSNLLSYNFKAGTFFSYDTKSEIVAELNEDFDTIRTINISLPTETISKNEMDSLETKIRKMQAGNTHWKSMKTMIPQPKAPASRMLYSDNHLWFKSNLESDHDSWFVSDMNGNLLKKMLLPKGSMLTHIHPKHLGVRIDDVTFALFSNPILGE